MRELPPSTYPAGGCPDGKRWTKVASPYWPAFARAWAVAADEIRAESVMEPKTVHLSGWGVTGEFSLLTEEMLVCVGKNCIV